jgi:hypothetical protein
MNEQVDRWHALASRLAFKVTTPVTLQLEGENVTFTALLPQFGGKKGMIADPDWEMLSRHRGALMNLGYGYSTVGLGGEPLDQNAKAMLRDWGWSASEPRPCWW